MEVEFLTLRLCGERRRFLAALGAKEGVETKPGVLPADLLTVPSLVADFCVFKLLGETLVTVDLADMDAV